MKPPEKPPDDLYSPRKALDSLPGILERTHALLAARLPKAKGEGGVDRVE